MPSQYHLEVAISTISRCIVPAEPRDASFNRIKDLDHPQLQSITCSGCMAMQPTSNDGKFAPTDPDRPFSHGCSFQDGMRCLDGFNWYAACNIGRSSNPVGHGSPGLARDGTRSQPSATRTASCIAMGSAAHVEAEECGWVPPTAPRWARRCGLKEPGSQGHVPPAPDPSAPVSSVPS